MFFSSLASGMTIKRASELARVHINTGQRWASKMKIAQAKLQIANAGAAKVKRQRGGADNEAWKEQQELNEQPPVIPLDLLCPEAKECLTNFPKFRRRYMGRVSEPWQEMLAVELKALYLSPEKEFVVVNVCPGAGKSSFFIDFAAWIICGNRSVRIMFYSASVALATQYSDMLRNTLASPIPVVATDKELASGLSFNAEACLSTDYGRFRPSSTGGQWRKGDFVVEQVTLAARSKKEPTVCAYGIDSEYIGHRAEIVLADDVATVENSRQGTAANTNLFERWDSMAETRLEPSGLLALIGQRLSGTDLYKHNLDKMSWDDGDEDDENFDEDGDALVEPVKVPKYKHIKFQAYYPELDTGRKSKLRSAPPWPDGPLLSPRRCAWASEIRPMMYSDPDGFRTVYQQEDASAGTFLIEETWIYGGVGPDGEMHPGCIDKERKAGYVPADLAEPTLSVACVDPSGTAKWALAWFVDQPETKQRFVIDLWRGKMSAEALLGYDTTTGVYSGIMDEWQKRSVQQKHPITHWIVEINAAQRYLLVHDFVRKWATMHNVKLVPHTTGTNKMDENLGIEALLPDLFRRGRLRLPTDRENWQVIAFIKEHTSWTAGKKKDTDFVMANWFGAYHIPNLKSFDELPPDEWRPSWIDTPWGRPTQQLARR